MSNDEIEEALRKFKESFENPKPRKIVIMTSPQLNKQIDEEMKRIIGNKLYDTRTESNI